MGPATTVEIRNNVGRGRNNERRGGGAICKTDIDLMTKKKTRLSGRVVWEKICTNKKKMKKKN